MNYGQKEYARGIVNTNAIEGVFSIFKRGMTGVYQHCDSKHLHRYLAEFDFRYNNRVRWKSMTLSGPTISWMGRPASD